MARARALLGTIVTIRLGGLAPELAQAAIASGFAEIARIHAAMSFQSGSSDVSRLNRAAHRKAVTIDGRTYAVLRRALQIAEESQGIFDPTIAPQLVASGLHHRPFDAPDADEAGSFRDILLLPDCQVRFARPVWIDLSGIAKGYAVDRAIERMAAFGEAQICVNAGGDLRVSGPAPERVALATGARADGRFALVDVLDGALASSSGTRAIQGAHVDGRSRKTIPPDRFVSVAAPSCMDADALTKVVLADPEGALTLLARYEARAFVFEADGLLRAPGLAA